MSKTPPISNSEIKQNILHLQKWMKDQSLDGFYISSFDEFLNEYVPFEDCHRIYVTGFTGSTAEVLMTQNEVKLYVDGRYFEQADSEVDASVINVVKCVQSIQSQLIDDIKSLGIKNLGYEGDRTSLSFLKTLDANTNTSGFYKNELNSIISFKKLPDLKKIVWIDRAHRGRDTLEKTALVLNNDFDAYFLTALDSIAWITNCRGYHLPNLSTFYSKALVTRKKAFVFVTPETPIDEKIKKQLGLEFISVSFTDVFGRLQKIQNELKLKNVFFDPNSMNCSDYRMLLEVFGPEGLSEKKGGIIEWQSIKEPVEMEEMRKGFKRSDQAIYKAMVWVKDGIKNNKRMTELDLYHQTDKFYAEVGSIEQSFKTIAGVGANASIIHYSNPSDEMVINNTHMVLLDSGGYYEGGFTTDTTRTFFAAWDGKPDPKQMEIYTLVLKGVLQCQNAVFPPGTKGNVLDGITRLPLYHKGYNFNHGTGHGVGIHVHEGGVSISPRSDLPMKVGQVVSIEPGIYIPGFGGVRIENIAHVILHPTLPGMLCFEPLVYIGFDPLLIDQSLLNSDEIIWLNEYEKMCKTRGTSFRKG